MKKDAADHFVTGALGEQLLRVICSDARHHLLLTGHSAGSIWASEMLLAAHREQLSFPVDLVFLAPAVRSLQFAKVLAAKGQDIKKFRIYAMHDQLERHDVLFGKGYGFLYPSSLLYFVSGVCEGRGLASADAPILGMERFLQADTPWLNDVPEREALDTVRGFFGKAGMPVYSVATAGAGFNSDAVSHGAFDDDPATLASVATFFQEA